MKLTRAQKDLIKYIASCVNTFHMINVNGHSTQVFFTDLHTFKHKLYLTKNQTSKLLLPKQFFTTISSEIGIPN